MHLYKYWSSALFCPIWKGKLMSCLIPSPPPPIPPPPNKPVCKLPNSLSFPTSLKATDAPASKQHRKRGELFCFYTDCPQSAAEDETRQQLVGSRGATLPQPPSSLAPQGHKWFIFQVPNLETLWEALPTCHPSTRQLRPMTARNTQHPRGQRGLAKPTPDQESKSCKWHRGTSSTSPFQFPYLQREFFFPAMRAHSLWTRCSKEATNTLKTNKFPLNFLFSAITEAGTSNWIRKKEILKYHSVSPVQLKKKEVVMGSVV